MKATLFLPINSATSSVTSGCGGTFKMYQGTTDITTLCTYSVVANPSTLTVALNAATGVYVVSGGYPTGTDTTTITFRATFGTATFDKVFTITKSKNGTVGQRGSRTWYVGLTGTTATYSDTLATTTATQDGGPILNDTVTQYNNSQNFSQTKFWDGAVWQIVNAVVDGNLLVSGTVGTTHLAANAVTAGKIAAGAVDATKITVSDLSAIQASLGTVQVNSNGYIRSNGATAFGTGTGFWMGWDTTAYKFRIGDPAGNKLEWTGSTLNVKGRYHWFDWHIRRQSQCRRWTVHCERLQWCCFYQKRNVWCASGDGKQCYQGVRLVWCPSCSTWRSGRIRT
jgi:hypothetical protein